MVLGIWCQYYGTEMKWTLRNFLYVISTVQYSMFRANIWKISEFFLSENFQFLEVKFSVYLNRRVFEMGMLSVRWHLYIITFESGYSISYKIAYAPSKDSDKPVFWVFAWPTCCFVGRDVLYNIGMVYCSIWQGKFHYHDGESLRPANDILSSRASKWIILYNQVMQYTTHLIKMVEMFDTDHYNKDWEPRRLIRIYTACHLSFGLTSVDTTIKITDWLRVVYNTAMLCKI